MSSIHNIVTFVCGQSKTLFINVPLCLICEWNCRIQINGKSDSLTTALKASRVRLIIGLIKARIWQWHLVVEKTDLNAMSPGNACQGLLFIELRSRQDGTAPWTVKAAIIEFWRSKGDLNKPKYSYLCTVW